METKLFVISLFLEMYLIRCRLDFPSSLHFRSEMHIIRCMLQSDKRHEVFAEAKRKQHFFHFRLSFFKYRLGLGLLFCLLEE